MESKRDKERRMRKSRRRRERVEKRHLTWTVSLICGILAVSGSVTTLVCMNTVAIVAAES